MATRTKSVLLLGRRAYTAVADYVKKVQTGVKSPAMIVGSKEKGASVPEPVVFWMRHPKTGYYVPETHFDAIDAADLRHKFLSKKY